MPAAAKEKHIGLTSAFDSAVAGRVWKNAVQISSWRAHGSGVVLQNEWVLTASHAIERVAFRKLSIYHPANDMQTEVASVHANWREFDLAVLKLKQPLDVSPVKLGEKIMPKEHVISCDVVGLKKTISGEGHPGRNAVRHGQYLQEERYAPMGKKGPLADFTSAFFGMYVQSGNSGSGIFNARGELVSLVHGSNEGDDERAGDERTYGALPEKIKEFLSRSLPEFFMK